VTKEELKQIYYINKEIRMWNKELESLQCKSLDLGQRITGMPHSSSGISDKVGELAVNITDIEAIIRGKSAEIQIQRKRIIEYINGIDDSLLRQITFLRNVSCMSWKQVAIEIGGGNTPDSVRVAYDRYFENK